MAHLIEYDNGVEDLQVPRLFINLLDPLVDAGDVAEVVEAALAPLESVEVARFDSDVIYDFRAQRPIASYLDGKLADVVTPSMTLDLMSDMDGQKFLYLHGHEPDFRWPSLSSDIIELIGKFGVQEVFAFAGIPAGVPHTRPADMLIRATAREDVPRVKGTAEHFSQLADYFEYVAGEQGISVTNIRVRVPFYMARGPHPFISGALAVLKMMSDLGGPTLPVGDLEQLEDQQNRDLEAMVEEGSDFAELLTRLEADYDRLPEDVGFAKATDGLPAIPSSEEIDRAAEQFLANLSHDSLTEALGSSSSEPDFNESESSEKHKDGSADFNPPEPKKSGQPGGIIARLRRGKHHRDPNE